MEPISIYVNETPIDKEKRLTLNFADEEQIKQVLFSPKKDYYISTMTCNLEFHEYKTSRDLKAKDYWNEILELSKLNWELLSKGSDYQNDMREVSFLIDEKGLTKQDKKLSIVLGEVIRDASYFKYTFLDTVDYRNKRCEIYSP